MVGTGVVLFECQRASGVPGVKVRATMHFRCGQVVDHPSIVYQLLKVPKGIKLSAMLWCLPAVKP